MNRLVYRQNEKVAWIAGGGARLLLWAQAATVVALVIFSIWQRHQIIHLGYETGQMARARQEAEQIHRRLQVEVESLNAVERIERVAVRQLQMKSGRSDERIYIPTPIGVAASASLAANGSRRPDAR